MAQTSQERKWMKAVRRGDFEAFEQLYRAYYRRLYGFFYRLCWDAARSEDLLQETFIKLWQNAQKFQLDRPLAPWLYRMGKNVFLDAERKRKRDEPPGGSLEDVPEKGLTARVSELLMARTARDGSSTAVAPDTQITRRETEEAVRLALGRLDPEKRLVVVLSFYQGLAYRDIAEILDIKLGTVKSRMHYAEQALRETLKPLMGEA